MSSSMIWIFLAAALSGTMADNSELQILQSNGQFTNKLYSILSKESGGNDNIFFSPFSAHVVLSMSYLGAAGTTETAYNKVLNLPDKEVLTKGYKDIIKRLNNVKNVTLSIADKSYVSQGFKLKPAVATSVAETFNSEIEQIDFSNSAKAASTINSWVEEHTNFKIKNLISADSLDQLTRLVLVNAVYFKGNWQNKFDPQSTRTEPFYVNENVTYDVQMMHINKKFNFKHDSDLKAKVVELPYQNPDVSMVIILPDDKDGIQDLEKKLEKVDLTKITEGSWQTEVELALPKFRIETTIPLEAPLKEMGLGEIFDPLKANFSNLIEGDEKVYVSKVIQKAFIEVDEQGAEAAAATGFIIHAYSAPRISYFLADHPFILLLKSSSTILFVGKCAHPMSGNTNIAPKGTPVKDPFARNIYITLED